MRSLPVMPEEIEVVQADLAVPHHQDAVVSLMNAYASHPMGNGEELPEEVQANLIQGLRDHPTTMIFLAMSGENSVGIAACFRGFSTFAAKPLLNIHDFYVDAKWRGHGVGRLLLEHVEQAAKDSGCCKLTLEVQENNHRARRVYNTFGFAQTTYQEEAGGSLFFSKPF